MPGKRFGGFVLWEGESRFDHSPLVVIVTEGSTNRKTGNMDQAWVLRRDVHPFHAIRTGEDAAICGDCAHRANPRSCYVTVQHGPANIWRTYKGDKYDDLSRDTLDNAKAIVARITGRFLRFGAYGDPTAVPIEVWASMLPFLKGWTGYTHFWRNVANQPYRSFCMASVDSEADREAALARGWRTFRVRGGSGGLLTGEIICPASQEAGHRLTCQQCRICAGSGGAGSTRSVAIYAHGPGKVNFFRNAQEALFS